MREGKLTDSVSPLVGPLHQTLEHALCQNTSDDPADVDV